MSNLATAIRLAAAIHRDQLDKAGKPYILHPIRVMMRGQTIDEMIVGVLHDTAEDSGNPVQTLKTIRELFGPVISDAVERLTRRHDEPYERFIKRCVFDPLAARRSRQVE